jgi:hypothetical protein
MRRLDGGDDYAPGRNFGKLIVQVGQ